MEGNQWKKQKGGEITMPETYKNIPAIREYFEKGKYGRKVDVRELKDLTLDERIMLGRLSREALAKNWD